MDEMDAMETPEKGSRKEVVAGLLREVWSAGDAAATARYVAESYTIHHDPGDPWEGRALDVAGYVERVRVSRAPFPDQEFTVLAMYEEGDAVVATWRWTGTHLGDIPGFPASGRVLEMSGATVYYFSGSRVAGHWQITDRLGIYRQLSAPRS